MTEQSTETTTGTNPEATGVESKPVTTAAEVKPTGTEEPKQAPKGGGEDWEARFKGLQPKVQELAEANKALTSERLQHLGRISELEGLLTASDKKIEESQKQLDAATSAQTEFQETINTLEKEAERATLIMSDYPDLAQMEAKGLIAPGLFGEELKTKLEDLRSVLKSKGANVVETLIAGSTSVEETKTGSRTQGDTVADIDQLMQAAMKNGDMKEVDRLEQLLIKQANREVFQQGGAPAT